jgi:hypothetical protein
VPKIAVGIPAINRAPVLCKTLARLALQTHSPEKAIVCGDVKPGDTEGVDTALLGADLLHAEAGSERNVVIYDNDFLAQTGKVLVDSIDGTGLSVATGTAIVARDRLGCGANRDFPRHIRAYMANTIKIDAAPWGCTRVSNRDADPVCDLDIHRLRIGQPIYLPNGVANQPAER